MHRDPIPDTATTGWQARLDLRFARRDGGTILAERRHSGPLRVQKALHPEGEEVCHAIVLHPPAGVAGGDELDIHVQLDMAAHALLTTPGAGKWYRSAGPWARQALDFEVAENAVMEWLPQETIVFDGARARMCTTVDLENGARFIGVETLCLGRRASGEMFSRGQLQLATDIRIEGEPLWRERGRLDGGSPLLDSPIGLAGFSVCSTVLAAGAEVDAATLAACRNVAATETSAQWGVSALPRLFVGRYLGHSSEAARAWFVELWRALRPAFVGREATVPRIWNT
jgi:urease accessory protein